MITTTPIKRRQNLDVPETLSSKNLVVSERATLKEILLDGCSIVKVDGEDVLLFDYAIASKKEIQAWSDDGTGLPSSLLEALPVAGYDTLEARGIAAFDQAQFTVASGIVTIKDSILVPASHTHPMADVVGLADALASKVDNSRVLTDVPEDALFTDTIYIKPSSEPISYIFGLQDALDGKVDDSQVLTDVPLGALFTDTIYSHPSKAWVDKSPLTGNHVISNLSVDSTGHPTDWTTRQLSVSDIDAMLAILAGFTWSDETGEGYPTLRITGNLQATGDVQAFTNTGNPGTIFDNIPKAGLFNPLAKDPTSDPFGLATFDNDYFELDETSGYITLKPGSAGTYDHTLLSNIGNNSHAQIDEFINSKGVANGLASLNAQGFVENTQLPSYVDDVLEYADFASLPTTGETGKIYITIDTNITYRWSGTVYVEISSSLALGETESTAYRGDRGKVAYDHSQSAHQVILNGTGFVKVNGTTLSYDPSSYELSFSKNTAFNKNFGTTSGTVAQGNDSRIVNGQTAYTWGDWETGVNKTFVDALGVDASTLNSLSSSQFLRSDVDSTLTAAIYGSDAKPLLQVNGSKAYLGSTSRAGLQLASSINPTWKTATNEYTLYNTSNANLTTVSWNANVFTSAGLGQFYHLAGTGTYLRSYEHGMPIRLQGENASGTNTSIFYGSPDNVCVLYYAGSSKFSTTSTGVGVNGDVAATTGTFSGTLTTAALNATNLSTNYVPYDNGTSLVNSPIATNGTSTVNIGGGTVSRELTVAGGGNVYIKVEGATTSDAALELSSDRGIYTLRNDYSSDSFTISTPDVADALTVGTNGNVLIGTTTDGGYKLDVNGITRSRDFILTEIEGGISFIDTLSDTTWKIHAAEDDSQLYFKKDDIVKIEVDEGLKAYGNIESTAKVIARQSFEIKNSSGVLKWTINLGASDVLEFKNASGVVEATLSQTGNLLAKGEMTAFSTGI